MLALLFHLHSSHPFYSLVANPPRSFFAPFSLGYSTHSCTRSYVWIFVLFFLVVCISSCWLFYPTSFFETWSQFRRVCLFIFLPLLSSFSSIFPCLKIPFSFIFLSFFPSVSNFVFPPHPTLEEKIISS